MSISHEPSLLGCTSPRMLVVKTQSPLKFNISGECRQELRVSSLGAQSRVTPSGSPYKLQRACLFCTRSHVPVYNGHPRTPPPSDVSLRQRGVFWGQE
eukprot:24852-Rhodomonas_salina.1